MKKNKFFWIIAAVVIAALAMTGCPPDDPGPGPEPEVELTGITVTPAERTIGVDQTSPNALVASPIPAEATLGEIEWSSEDESKVTVSDTGHITGVAVTEEGAPVKVYATSKANSSIKGYSEVTVTAQGVPATAIIVDPKTKTLAIGETFTLTYTQEPTDAADDVIWSSEDESKVTVDEETGEITALDATGDTPVKITATSVQNPEISDFSSITVTDEIPNSDVELKLVYIPSTTPIDTPPTLPEKDEHNIYTIEQVPERDGNFATADGFRDAILVYPDRVLNGNFKFRARVQIDFMGVTSASKGLIIGAFKGADGPGDFATGGGNTLTTGINLRANGVVRNFQSRAGDNLAAVGLNTTLPNKAEEFIYEVIRDENGIKSTMYISKNGAIMTVGSTQMTNTTPYTNNNGTPHIQADTPVYAGIAIFQVAAKVSQIELWDGDLEGAPVFYSGHSPAAPVPVTGISVTVQGEKGSFENTGVGTGTAANPAHYFVKLGDAEGSLQLEAVLQPAYADVLGAKFYTSTIPEHPADETIAVSESGTVTISGTGSKTIQAISNDEIGATYYLTITVTNDYEPVVAFNIVVDGTEMLAGGAAKNLSTDINFALITEPTVVWTTSAPTIVIFVTTGEGGEETAESVTGPTARIRGLAAGQATITATATNSDGGATTTTIDATKEFNVTSAAGQAFHWKFDATPEGYPPVSGNFDMGNGLVLSNGSRTNLVFTPTATPPASAEGFSTGYLATGGTGRFAYLNDLQGPFTITINYAGNGTPPTTGTYLGRAPAVHFPGRQPNSLTDPGDGYEITTSYVGGTYTAGAGIRPLVANSSTANSDPKTFVYNYTGTDKVSVELITEGNAIRVFDIIVQFGESGGGEPSETEDVFWNFSSTAFSALPATWTDTQTIESVSFIGGGNEMRYNANNKTIDGNTFSQRVQLNGTGTATTIRNIAFPVAGPCTVTAYAISGSTDATRVLILHDGTNQVGTFDVPDPIVAATYTYTGGAGTLYLYSQNSGINVYGLKVEY